MRTFRSVWPNGTNFEYFFQVSEHFDTYESCSTSPMSPEKFSQNVASMNRNFLNFRWLQARENSDRIPSHGIWAHNDTFLFVRVRFKRMLSNVFHRDSKRWIRSLFLASMNTYERGSICITEYERWNRVVVFRCTQNSMKIQLLVALLKASRNTVRNLQDLYYGDCRRIERWIPIRTSD